MAGYIELNIDQGASFNTTITIAESNGSIRNLSTFTAQSQMRKSYESLTYITLNTAIVNGSGGVISLSLSAPETANIKAGRYVYDVLTVDSGGSKQRVLEGIAIVSPGVTR